MASIDERVVGLRFDGSKFQSGIKPAIDGLDRLKSGLKLDGATKALGDLDSAGKSFSLANVGQAAEGVGLKFVALATIGITALSNIVNKAVDAGERIIKSLTIDPIKAGFDEYELKMGSIQTILANTARYGTSLEEVTGNLDALNDYADKTIYNFGDMTKNIGLFTNAGLRIEEATSLIKGFSNESAASGVSAQGAAGAAYQLSQALSAGQIRLMDWRSLTNVGLGNKNMQRGILDIALAMGTLEGKSITAADIQRDFNGSLEKGWLTADVMSNYLKIMSGDMDAATQASLGLSDAQISAFAKQQNTAEEAATKVRTYTQLLSTLRESVGSGWSQSFDIMLGDFEEATELFTGLNNYLGGVIGAMSDARNNLLQGWADAGGRTALIDGLTKSFQFLEKILKPIGLAFRDIFPPVTAEMLFKLTQGFQDFTEKLQVTANLNNNLRQTFKGVFAIFSIIWSVVKQVGGVLGDLFGVAAGGVGDILSVTASFGRFFVALDESIKKGEGLTKVFSFLGDVLRKPLELLKEFTGATADTASSIDFKEIWEGIARAFQAVYEFFKPVIDWFVETFRVVKDIVKDAFKTMDFNTLLGFINVGILGAIAVAITRFIKGIPKLFGGVGNGFITTIKDTFGALTDTLRVMQSSIKSDILIKIAVAVALLAASVAVLSLIDPEKLAGSLAALGTLIAALVTSMIVLDKEMGAKGMLRLPVVTAAMIGLATAILIMSTALLVLSNLSWDDIARSLTALAVSLGLLVGASVLISKNVGNMIAAGVGITALSVAMLILGSALHKFSELSWDDIQKGLVVLGGLLLIIGIFSKAVDEVKGLVAASFGIIVISLAMLVFASALERFSGMGWDELIRGMTAMAGALVIVAGALVLLDKAKFPVSSAFALIIVAGALHVMAGAMEKLGGMTWEEVAKGLIMLAGSLAIIAGALYLMTASLPGAAALIVAAFALAILAPVLVMLGALSWDNIGTGLGALAATLGILAGAGILLIPALPGLIGLGVAILLLGAGVLFASVGVAAFAVALGLLAVSGQAAIAMIGPAVQEFANMIPTIATKVGEGIGAFAVSISEQTGVIVQAMVDIFLALIKALVDIIPPLVDAAVLLVTKLIEALTALIPPLVDVAVLLITKLVEALVVLIPLLVDAGLKIVIGILDGIAKNIGQIVEKGTDLIVALLDGIGKAIPRLLIAGADLVIDFLNGIATTIREKSAEFQAAGTNIANAIIEGMTGGITKGITTVINSVKNMATNALNAAKKALGIASPSKEFKEVGKFSTEGLANGLTAFSSISEKAAGNLGKNTLKSLKKSMANAGDFMRFGGMDTQPTVRPVLDLSAIKRDAGLIGTIIGGQSLSVEGPTARVTAVSADYDDYQEAMAEANGPKTEVNMTQNNYSPKALPASEIYRQSKNQMSILKGELESA